MSPTRSKTIVLPSGETSMCIHVPCVTSYAMFFDVARFSRTFHFAGTDVFAVWVAPPDGGLGGGGGGGFCAAAGTAMEAARAAANVSWRMRPLRVRGVCKEQENGSRIRSLAAARAATGVVSPATI